jgi:hypothetical protein
MPHDIYIGDVYLPPLLVAAVVAMIVAAYCTHQMRERDVMQHFANPPLVYLSLTTIITVILSSTLFPN